MATVKWEIKAREFGSCTCAYGCPCQFNAPPTHGHCDAALAMEIEEGQFGDVSLDGLRAAWMVSFPGAIHQGNGTRQIIVDERADARQRDALVKIVSGQETEDMATIWWVFDAMSTKKLPPIFSRIDFQVDVEARKARVEIPGILRMSGEPIRNPVTGAEHRARIDLPADSFEFRVAEVGSAEAKAQGAIPMDLKGTYGQFAYLHLTNEGIPR